MPIPPEPFLLACTKCNWKAIYKPASDVIMVSTDCRKCGSETKFEKPTKLDLIFTRKIKDTGKLF